MDYLLSFIIVCFITYLFFSFRLLREILNTVSESNETIKEISECLFTSHGEYGEAQVTIANTLDIIRQDAKGLRKLDLIHQELKEIREALKNK